MTPLYRTGQNAVFPRALSGIAALAALMFTIGAEAATGSDWPQYSSNPFVIDLGLPPHEDSRGSVVAADLDGDGLMDYLVTCPGHIGAYSHHGKPLWVLDVDVQVSSESERNGLPGHHGPGVQAGDVDGDGRAEVVFLTRDGYLHMVDGATGKSRARHAPKPPKGAERWEHVVIANFRGLGDRDLLLQATNKDGYRMGRYLAAFAADKLDGEPLWRVDKYVGCAHTGARVADLDGDGRDEVLGATIIGPDGDLHSMFSVDGHLDAIHAFDVVPDEPGLEVVGLEEGRKQRVFVFNKKRVIWESDYERQEPQNAAIGEFDPKRSGLEIWCRSRYDEHQKPFVLDSRGNLAATYEMDKVAPEGWTTKGVEVIWTIDWTGGPTQLAAAKERHRSGDVCVFDPLTGKFVKRITQKADRLYVADVSGDWREEILVISGGKLYIYHNEEPNPDPNRPRLWLQNYYRRAKMTWNYYAT